MPTSPRKFDRDFHSKNFDSLFIRHSTVSSFPSFKTDPWILVSSSFSTHFLFHCKLSAHFCRFFVNRWESWFFSFFWWTYFTCSQDNPVLYSLKKMGLLSGIFLGMIFGIAVMAGWNHMMRYRSIKRVSKVRCFCDALLAFSNSIFIGLI